MHCARLRQEIFDDTKLQADALLAGRWPPCCRSPSIVTHRSRCHSDKWGAATSCNSVRTFLQVGGVPAVLKLLLKEGLIDGSCLTVTGADVFCCRVHFHAVPGIRRVAFAVRDMAGAEEPGHMSLAIESSSQSLK